MSRTEFTGARRALLALLLVASTASGCASSSDEDACSFHGDCPEGQACWAGVCRPGCRGDEDCAGSQRCGPQARCEDLGDLGPAEDLGGEPDGVCVPNRDGRIERAEVRLAPGAGALFTEWRGDPEELGLELALQPAGSPAVFSFDGLAGSEQARFVALLDPSAVAAGAAFPDASYASELPGSGGLLAFFALDSSELRMLGLAEPRGEQTVLHYDPPVPVLRFPLEPGQVWEEETRLSGRFFGADVLLEEHHRREVLRAGEAELPAGRLPVLQILAGVERHSPGNGRTQRFVSVEWLGECAGFVARAQGFEGSLELPQHLHSLQLLASQRCRVDGDCGLGGRCDAEGFCAASPYVEQEPECRGDGDGRIADDEFIARPGMAGLFARNPGGSEASVDLVGELVQDQRRWVLAEPSEARVDELELLLAPGERWFGGQFPAATHLALLDAATRTWAAFRREAGRLLLLGIASEEPGQTLLVYEQPVESLRFPLALGDRWTAETPAAGSVGGQELRVDMSYTFEVDAAGRIDLPAGSVDVLRLRIDSVQQVRGAPTAISRRSYLFVAECLGSVARVVSRVNEAEPEFHQATELSRLTLPHCLDGSGCRWGLRCEQGLCVGDEPQPELDGGVPDDLGPADLGGDEPDQGGDPSDLGPVDSGVPLCDPQGDGRIERGEFPLRAGLTAVLRVASSEAGLDVELAGSPCAAGRCWDLAAARGGDRDLVTELIPVAGAWFAEDFPDASYATLLDEENEWLGIFRLSDAGLELLGTASAEPGDMRTVYDPPVSLYRFPLAVGDQWEVESSQSGYWGFTPLYTDDQYQVRVAAEGRLATPAGDFTVLQVVTRVQQHVPFTIFSEERVVHTFLGECFGILGRVESLEGEEEDFFTRAARIERLAPLR